MRGLRVRRAPGLRRGEGDCTQGGCLFIRRALFLRQVAAIGLHLEGGPASGSPLRGRLQLGVGFGLGLGLEWHRGELHQAAQLLYQPLAHVSLAARGGPCYYYAESLTALAFAARRLPLAHQVRFGRRRPFGGRLLGGRRHRIDRCRSSATCTQQWGQGLVGKLSGKKTRLSRVVGQ